MLMYALASRARTCMSPIIPAQPTPMLSVILKTFFATLLMTKVPYEYLRSDARIAPSLQTSPTVVAPGIKPSSLINRAESANPSSVAIKVASRETEPSAALQPTKRHALAALAWVEHYSREERTDGSRPQVRR